MPITKHNFMRHELIGLEVVVLESSDPSLKSLKGIVVDETKNMLKIEAGEKVKSVPKSVVHLRFTLPNGEDVEIEGIRLVGRPEDRVRRG